jgi:ABC-type uncharacterized transport system substrate-binding protein
VIGPERGRIQAQALEQRLADLGYVEGRNITLLKRFAGPQMDKIEEAVISLVPQIDLLVVTGNAASAAKKLAGGVPTVFISIGYPVELGYVQSLAHPGGNMTGSPPKPRWRQRKKTADTQGNRPGPPPSGCPSRFR